MTTAFSAQRAKRAWRDLKMAPKLIGAFLFICLITMLGGLLGIWGMDQINQQTGVIANAHLPAVQDLGSMQRAFQQAQIDFRDAVFGSRPNACG
jgi:uncharacterized iron-regulated membrane protein